MKPGHMMAVLNGDAPLEPLDWEHWEKKRRTETQQRKDAIMQLHDKTFGYLKPNDAQVDDMDVMRGAAKTYADAIETMVPDGPDKTYILRKLREVAMWVNVAITRQPDGSPRADQS